MKRGTNAKMHCPQTQLLQKLTALNSSNVVLALTTGGVVGMDWEAANVPAIVVAW